MKCRLYDVVELQDGRKGTVIEVYKDGEAYEIELDEEFWDGDDWALDTVKPEKIKRIIGSISKD